MKPYIYQIIFGISWMDPGTVCLRLKEYDHWMLPTYYLWYTSKIIMQNCTCLITLWCHRKYVHINIMFADEDSEGQIELSSEILWNILQRHFHFDLISNLNLNITSRRVIRQVPHGWVLLCLDVLHFENLETTFEKKMLILNIYFFIWFMVIMLLIFSVYHLQIRCNSNLLGSYVFPLLLFTPW